MKPGLLRELLGEALREQRFAQCRTLREVSSDARVSLGYLSEVERGQKEASSELISSICHVADRGDEFAGRLLLPSLDLGEISQGHAGIRGDFAQGTTLRETLLPECLAQKFT